MENKTYKIDNTDYLTLDGSASTIKIIKGSAYLFVTRVLEDGRPGARHEVAAYKEGDSLPNFKSTEKYKLILSGTNDTQVKVSSVSGSSWQEEAEKEQARIIQALEDKEKDYEVRSVKQQKLSEQAFSRALENISSVVRREKSLSSDFEEEDSPVVKVFKLIANKTGGLKVRAVPGKEYKSSKAGIQQIAKDNNVRVREVVLRDNWYKEDNGHLIAFYNKSAAIDLKQGFTEASEIIPVALIKNIEHSGYMLVNPEDASSFPVTKENAAQIHPMAFMMYRSMDSLTSAGSGHKLTLKSICKFVFADIKADILRFILIGILCTLIGLISPLITKHFIDNVIPEAAKNQAIQICILVFFCNISSMVGSIAKYFANIRMETRADSDLEASIMDRLLKLPVEFFKGFTAGDLAARTMTVSQIRSQVFNIVLSTFMNFIFSLVYLIQAFRFCPYFAKKGMFLCLIPIAVSCIICFITYKWEKLLVEAQGKIQGMLLEFIGAIEKITNTNSEKRVFAKWSNEYIRQAKMSYTLGLIGIVASLVNTIYPTAVSIVFYYLYGRGVRLQTIHGLTTGGFMAFLNAFGSYQSAIIAVAGSLLGIRNIIPLYKRFKPIADAEPESEESKAPVDSLKGNIEIAHLNFRYQPDAPLVLKDVNMRIKKGEFVAIVGTSGAGKSTLMRMLLGFEKPESGTIFYDDMDMSTVDIGSLRRQMGVVLQNDTVMQGTILQNIVGSTGLKEADAWEAARKVSLDKDIKEMPMGMFTMVPAGGMTLSGGQLQRLIIARAIIRNPSLLIFDEATSALDNLTQVTVRKSLDELNVTRIIIAHRLSTVINADKIYVMKDGQIIESGNYKELMEEKGYFAELAGRQNL